MYHVISPEVLAESRGLSIGATAFFLFVGFMLWGFGWRWHKFWVVFTITVVAGLLGISYGRAVGVQALVLGVLIATSAGLMAIELAKIFAFMTGGLAAWLGAQVLLQQGQELWAAFLCGGIVGVLLSKLWTMLATSFVGTVLCGHTLLIFLEVAKVIKMAEFAEKYGAAINAWAIASTVIGVLVQSKTAKKDQSKDEKGEKPAEAEAEKPTEPAKPKVRLAA